MNHNIINYLNQAKTLSFRDKLFQLIDNSGEKDSDVYNRVNIDRRIFSKIRCRENYIPKKENIIKMCLSLKLDSTESEKLLESAGYVLCSNNNFDLIIRYCLNNHIYDIDEVNDYLFQNNETVLS